MAPSRRSKVCMGTKLMEKKINQRLFVPSVHDNLNIQLYLPAQCLLISIQFKKRKPHVGQVIQTL